MERMKINVTVEIPKNELQLLADQDFLGSSFDMPKWMTQAIHEALTRELDKLALTNLRRVRRLEKKYGLEKPVEHYEGETAKPDVQRENALNALNEIQKEREA